ncbi:Juxtaposed with another zinc finger protein 1 [Nibea albiflora]|uniref:Juxtaposed with another zinc finger protein 1 n=1 Tax=Nibea albiflora TaxID=240163 RepID=A0ACB7ESC2_NIBAL|nr:Juxtaposed with another zinc finger protein 1 [Nibea albiflora]
MPPSSPTPIPTPTVPPASQLRPPLSCLAARCLLLLRRSALCGAPTPNPKTLPPRSPPPASRPPSPPGECTSAENMTGIAAASFFSNSCRFGGCGLQFESLAELIVHIEDNHIDTDPRVLEKQEQQQPTYLALSYINRFMTDAARREQETMKKKATPKLSLSITGGVSRNSTATPPRHTSGNLTPPVTPPITPSSSFRSSTPTGSEYDEEEVDYEESDSDESWTTESAISSESILSSMCMNGGEEKPFACPVPGCKKRYKNVNGIKYHAKNGHRTQIRVRKPFKCRCGKSYKTSQGLRHHTINFHPPVSTEILRKIQG